MFEALRSTGELWRPSRADHTGRCSCCNGPMVAVAAGHRRGFYWSHECTGPGDGWRAEMTELLERCGFKSGGFKASMIRGKTCVLLADGWRTIPAGDVEMEVAVAGWLPIWMVDARDVCAHYGTGLPGAECPSHVGAAAWSKFAATWFGRDVPVVMHLRNVARGYPDTPEDAVYFVPEVPCPGTARPRGGPMRGVESRWTNGRATTLRDFVIVASGLGSDAAASFRAQPPHTLDLPAWVSHDGLAPTVRDKSFAAHQRRMAARRSH